MNIAQASHEKRTIRVKEFLDDFRSGMHDRELLNKYQLTEMGLEKFYEMLEERGILHAEEIRDHSWNQRESSRASLDMADERSSYICPCCLASHETMFDICPSCGVSFHALISQGTAGFTQPSEDEEHRHIVQEQSAEPQAEEPKVVGAAHATDAVQQSEAEDSGKNIQDIPSKRQDDGEFFPSEGIPKFQSVFEDLPEDIVSGEPLQSHAATDHFVEVLCDSCEHPAEPGIRNVYCRKTALLAVMFAAICFVTGFLGTASLSFFDGQSFSRLIVFFCTVVVMLLGVIWATTGAFLLLAREKVYFCPSCHRVYSRI
ncbi:MAG TPA: hypothetical protein VMC85_12020 [Desulfomonilaceae bacterium]|nr:hypothetical protein [Desulfomonilaceae bacterium]